MCHGKNIGDTRVWVQMKFSQGVKMGGYPNYLNSLVRKVWIFLGTIQITIWSKQALA